MDVSCILMAKGFIYPGVVLDWSSHPMLSRRVSITMEAACFIGALEEALLCHGKPEIFNTDDARCRRWRHSSSVHARRLRLPALWAGRGMVRLTKGNRQIDQRKRGI